VSTDHRARYMCVLLAGGICVSSYSCYQKEKEDTHIPLYVCPLTLATRRRRYVCVLLYVCALSLATRRGEERPEGAGPALELIGGAICVSS
jgi:hypothetical protein